MNARTRKNKTPDMIPESSGEMNQDITGIEDIEEQMSTKIRNQNLL